MYTLPISNQKTKTFKVGLYIRLSREDGDKEESSSVTNQREILKRFINENENFFIVKEYVDDGWTGTNFNRPSFKEMIKDIEKGIIDTVITKDLSRLGRDYIDTGYYLQRYFPEHSVRYIAILDNIDTIEDAGMSDIAPFKSIINDMYVKDISKKIRSSLTERRKAGNFLGVTAPYGYQKDPENKYHLIIEPNEAEVVKRVFLLYLQGNGLTKIAQILTKEAIPVPGETRNIGKTKKTVLYGSWKQTTIRRILENRVYLGDLVQFKRKNVNYKSKIRVKVPEEERVICKGTHEAIITGEEFDKVQQILGKNTSFKGTKHDYLFKGLLFCAECGARLNVTYSNYALKKYGEYRYTTICYSYSRLYSDICTRHSNSIPVLEELLISHIKEVCKKYISKDLPDELIKIAQQEKRKQQEQFDARKRIEELEQRIEDSSLYIKNLYKDKVKGIVSETDYIQLTQEFAKDRDSYIEEKSKLEEQLNQKCAQKEDIGKLEKLANEFISLERPTKALLHDLIEKITISEEHEITIYYKFSELNQMGRVEETKLEKAKVVNSRNKKAS
ncbi:MAG: recombinase family protein [Clostridia bacterium]|nr:recombinase family protein [Clostridia bacterium]